MKYAVAGYNKNTDKLIVKIMDEKDVIELLKNEHHFSFDDSKIERFKAEAAGRKGYYVDFNNGCRFRIVTVS